MDDTLYDLSQLHELSSGSPEFVDKMVSMFIELTPGLLERIRNGLEEKDYAEVKAAAHKMKPSIDMMGIKSLHTTVRTIENYAAEEVHVDQLPGLIRELDDTLQIVLKELKNH